MPDFSAPAMGRTSEFDATVDATLDATFHATFDMADDLDAINRLCIERGWSDGLPIVPPTTTRVAQMLAWCDRPHDTPIAHIAPRRGAATPRRLAANAVMAGCRPEYFPLVMLAIEALCEGAFNLHGIQTTTHPVAPLIIVNGPIARELDINAGHNAFGPGRQANAAIGRAIRLALLNIGGAIPGVGDMATLGSPAKYTWCVAENEIDSPWEPLHVERGFAFEASTVTVVGGEGPHNITDHESTDAAGLLKGICNSMAIPGANNATVGDVRFAGEPMLVLCPEHAALIATAGYSKRDLKQHLFENARVPVRNYPDAIIENRLRNSGRFDGQLDLPLHERRVPLAARAEDFMVIVLGGAGKHSAFIPTFAITRAVTRVLRRADGRVAASLAELRQD